MLSSLPHRYSQRAPHGVASPDRLVLLVQIVVFRRRVASRWGWEEARVPAMDELAGTRQQARAAPAGCVGIVDRPGVRIPDYQLEKSSSWIDRPIPVFLRRFWAYRWLLCICRKSGVSPIRILSEHDWIGRGREKTP
jgi:hypothetical protein